MGNTGEDSEDKSESIIDKIKNLPDFVKYGLGLISGVLIGGIGVIGVRALCNKKEDGFKLGHLEVRFPKSYGEVCYVGTFDNMRVNLDFSGCKIKIGEQLEKLIGLGSEIDGKRLCADLLTAKFFTDETVKSKYSSKKEKLSPYSRAFYKFVIAESEQSSKTVDGILKDFNELGSGFRFTNLSFSTFIDKNSKFVELPLSVELAKLLFETEKKKKYLKTRKNKIFQPFKNPKNPPMKMMIKVIIDNNS
ncbi:MAG: hypothetical protein CfP315_0443 [Candidatus Improbicoccus pseudotrichonymphae]|uniref:Uncharacterized protein n=1 Tax=Candidatus Improbicoccus pseudotrichonymphae TaxID=3033792 RepID=A0AA48I883_9FIRM|nr:MAG: hypothetical protein CfP315_0443 [Candidatus Improbicoccus pseudotrichonymphae]